MGASNFVGFLEGNIKYKYRNREFWREGYHVDIVGKNAGKITECIQRQQEEDATSDSPILDLPVPSQTKYRSGVAGSMRVAPVTETLRVLRGGGFSAFNAV